MHAPIAIGTLLTLLALLSTGCQRTIELGLPESPADTMDSSSDSTTDTETTTSSETTAADNTD